MIETHTARHDLVTASCAHLAPVGRPAAEHPADPAVFWNRPASVATLTALDRAYPELAHLDLTAPELADLEAPTTWWPTVLVVLLAAVAGLALFGVL